MRLSTLPCLLAAVVLAACSSANLQQLKQTEIKGDVFHTELAKSYRDFADELEKSSHITAADHFAAKGLKAAANEDVAPEELSAWTLDDEATAELEPAHDALLDALTPEMIRGRPEKAAHAQFAFDSWVEKAAEPADTTSYRQRFLAALSELSAPALPTPQTGGNPNAIVQTNYVILFDWNSASLDKVALETLKHVYKDMIGSRSVVLNGHTDTSGPADYNMELSLKRAESAEAALVDLGTLKEMIETFAFGETDPKVKTGDGVKNRTNRRVEIFINR